MTEQDSSQAKIERQESIRLFLSLADQWRNEIGMLSSISQITAHPAYQQIIEMGEKAVPFILQELQKRPDHWFQALQSITGENPVPLEAAGNLQQMADAWLRWGNEKGFLVKHGLGT